jgi:hypothetical protein
MEIVTKIKGADGGAIDRTIHNTIHQLRGDKVSLR